MTLGSVPSGKIRTESGRMPSGSSAAGILMLSPLGVCTNVFVMVVRPLACSSGQL
ncbi:Uncharacterised protein [Mycobacteroides abscessus subsp. abscessus]|nr:Uncharacterised protein [Mycobacteroides abscessus subsp. abscessus]SIL43399.1 Uncharacterised protein [Mycobacteroides abscessus subsp. abscessus]SIN58840.1 Uncharacterised protein [Mycobacteroides abscessus subsp. abscessus]SKU09690.1 Uncharacterised protein [Mycobacteroides abscessus subsp. abscessus]